MAALEAIAAVSIIICRLFIFSPLATKQKHLNEAKIRSLRSDASMNPLKGYSDSLEGKLRSHANDARKIRRVPVEVSKLS